MAASIAEKALRRDSTLIPVGDFDIFVELDGEGPYMIMTHGLGSGSHVFQPMVEILSSQYTCVRVDWPGHGGSSLNKTGRKFIMPDLVLILHGVMNHFAMDSVILVGHSAGGCVSMMLASQWSSRISGLAVLGSGRTRSNQPEAKGFTLLLADEARAKGTREFVDARVKYNIPDRSAPLTRALLRCVTATTSPEGYAQLCEALCNDSHIDPDYSKIVCPTCIIGGVNDAISPPNVTDELVSLIATSGKAPSCHVLDTGHMMMIEDIEGTVKALRSMLSKV